MTLLIVIVVLGVVIFVHELGHFLAAKAVGVQVLRFSIGFGPPLLAWRRGETEYWLAWVPLGGYVKMAGLEEEGGDLTSKLEGGAAATPIDPARTLESKSVPARLLVMVAGVTMNVLLAFVLHTGIHAVASPQAAMLAVDSVAMDSLPAGASGLAALSGGVRVVRINGDSLRTWHEFERWIVRGPDTLQLELAGRVAPFVLTLPADTVDRRAAWNAIEPQLPPAIGILFPGEPAHRAGLRPGDVIVRIGADSIRSWSHLVATIRRSAGDSLRLVVLRGAERLEFTVVPKLHTEEGADGAPDRQYGLIGANPNPPVVHVPEPLGVAVVDGLKETAERTALVAVFLKRLVTREVSLKEVGGPVLIAQLSGQAAQLGIVTLLSFVAFISLNLAVLNILPIPVLDGGHVAFLLIEAVRGKPLGMNVRLRLTQVGFVLLMALMVLAISNDVIRTLR